MSVTVRYADYGDEDVVAALLVDIHALHAEGRPDLFGMGRSKYSADEVRAMFHDPALPFFVAVEEGEVLGYAICKLIENNNPAQGQYTTLYIDDLNVAKSARRKGVGSALIRACRALAKEKYCYNVTLNVWAFNAGAISFYENCGFSCQRMILEDIL